MGLAYIFWVFSGGGGVEVEFYFLFYFTIIYFYFFLGGGGDWAFTDGGKFTPVSRQQHIISFSECKVQEFDSMSVIYSFTEAVVKIERILAMFILMGYTTVKEMIFQDRTLDVFIRIVDITKKGRNKHDW